MTPQDAVAGLQSKQNPTGQALFMKPPNSGLYQFYLIRHGATDLNAGHGNTDKIRGWSNVPLNEHGREEADQLGKKLANSGIRTLVHSDLSRAKDTAQAIASTTGAKMVSAPLLRPWNVGIYTGKDSNAAHPELQRLAIERPDETIPEGESFNQFKDRAFKGLHMAVLEGQGEPMGLVTHHRVERLFNAWDKAGQKPDLSLDYPTMFSKGEKPASAEPFSVDPKMFGINQ